MAAANHDFKQVVYVHNRRELARLLNVLVPEKGSPTSDSRQQISQAVAAFSQSPHQLND